MAVAAAGVATGVIAAAALTRVMATVLYEVSPTDAPTFVTVIAVIALFSLLACSGRRCARRGSTRSTRCAPNSQSGPGRPPRPTLCDARQSIAKQ
jgi:putative ABC transport system permease protein